MFDMFHSRHDSDSDSEVDFPSSVQSDHTTNASSSLNSPSTPSIPAPSSAGMREVLEAIDGLRVFVTDELAKMREDAAGTKEELLKVAEATRNNMGLDRKEALSHLTVCHRPF